MEIMLGSQGGSGSQKQPRMEMMKGDKLGRLGGSGITTIWRFQGSATQSLRSKSPIASSFDDALRRHYGVYTAISNPGQKSSYLGKKKTQDLKNRIIPQNERPPKPSQTLLSILVIEHCSLMNSTKELVGKNAKTV